MRKFLVIPFTKRTRDETEQIIALYKTSDQFKEGDEIVFPSSRDISYYEQLSSGDFKALSECLKAMYKAEEIVVIDGTPGEDPIMDILIATGIRYGINVQKGFTDNRYARISISEG